MSETYSILYDGGEEGNVQCAVDWDWKRTPKRTPAKWARSDKDGSGGIWSSIEGLDDKAYRALLKHFWLEDYADEFPMEKVISMSPAKLAAARRKKEKLHGLERKTMESDTLGSHRSAEEKE